MRILLNIKHLVNGGGNFEPSSFDLSNAPAYKRNALTFFSLFFFVLLFLVPALVSCSKGGDTVRPDDPVTRALSHEDSVRLGLILTADSAWDGVIDGSF